MNKHFFSLVKERLVGGFINLAKLSNAFYSKLFAYPFPDVHREECCAKLLSHVPCKFSHVAQKVLEAP